MPLVECVPNVSEGRRPEAIESIVTSLGRAALSPDAVKTPKTARSARKTVARVRTLTYSPRRGA